MVDELSGNVVRQLGRTRLDRRRLLKQAAAAGVAATAFGAGPLAKPAAAQSGGTLNIAWLGDLTNLTPLYTSSGQEQALTSLMFGTLIKPNNNLEPIPDLAESWEAAPDATSFTFVLR